MNTIKKYTGRSLWLAGLMMTTLMAGCLGGGGSSSDPTSDENGLAASEVSSTNPADGAIDVALNRNVIAIFDEELNDDSVTKETFTLSLNGTTIAGTVTYSEKVATFTPTDDLQVDQKYTATLTTGITDLTGKPLSADYAWSFTTGATTAAGPGPVNLGTAGNYAILAETKIEKTGTAGTAITGHIAISPAAATYIQGFSLTLDSTGCFSTPSPASLVTGKVYAADYNTGSCTTPAELTTAVGDMMTAYTDAKGRTTPDFLDLGAAGDIGGRTMVPGLYKYTTGLFINNNVTLSGGPNDVWIFQIAGDLTQANGTIVHLEGGALPKNIFWQVEGGNGAAIGTTAHFEGVILTAKAISVNTGATVNGRLLAQTAVTLDGNAVTQPAE